MTTTKITAITNMAAMIPPAKGATKSSTSPEILDSVTDSVDAVSTSVVTTNMGIGLIMIYISMQLAPPKSDNAPPLECEVQMSSTIHRAHITSAVSEITVTKHKIVHAY